MLETTLAPANQAPVQDLNQALNYYFGFSEFRGEQQTIIRNILAGNDTFVIMPTGAGKSLCYQLPAAMRPGTALVISPLIALMKNQVDQMRALGIEAGYLNSSMSRAEYNHVKETALSGELKLLYVAPETLVREDFIRFAQGLNLQFVAIDEAHCISEWGHDFRPEYRRIRPTLNEIGRVPLIALTATATPKVQLDIQQNLEIEDAGVFKTSFNRTNLYYEVRPKRKPAEQVVKYIKQHPMASGIVYCLSRKRVTQLAETLNVNGIKAVPYHAGLDSETRSRHQDMFLHEEVQVVVATIAFGMGIDKPDVRFVIHYDVPKSIESYYQETGRAGRDGRPADCILFYSFNDIIKLEKFMKDKPVSEREAGKHLLYEMANFCESGICRRRHLLHYFGEHYNTDRCAKMCDNCRNPKEQFDGTEIAQEALRAVQLTGEHFDMKYLVELLKGNANDQALHLHHQDLPVFGRYRDTDHNILKAVYTQLIVQEYLEKSIADYGVIRMCEKGHAFLQQPHPMKLYKFRDFNALLRKEEAEARDKAKAYDQELYDRLLKVREKLAKRYDLPPYALFQPAALEEMAARFPVSRQELQSVYGVGGPKARKFGSPILSEIQRYMEEKGIAQPEEVTVKSKIPNSSLKPFIIQQIDRKTPLDEIGEMKCLEYHEILNKVEQLVYSGARLNIDYYIDTVLDQDRQEDLLAYFRESTTDSLEAAEEEFNGEYSREEIQLMRMKFLLSVAA